MEELKAVNNQPEHSGGRAQRAHRRIDDGGKCCSDFRGAGTPHHEDDGIRLAGSGEHLSGRRRKLADQTSADHAKQRFTKGDWLPRHLPGGHMLADIGTKSLTSARLEKFKKGLGMKKIGKEEEKTEEPEEKTAPEEAEKIKKKEKGTRVPEEVEKAPQCVALMIAIQGAKAQDDEETEEQAEMYHIELVLMFALVGVVSVIQRIIPCLMGWLRRDRQPEGEPAEERSRARGTPTRHREEQVLRTPESTRRRRRVEARDEEDTDEEETDPGVPFPHGDRDGNLFLRNPPGPKSTAQTAGTHVSHAKGTAEGPASRPSMPTDRPTERPPTTGS